LANILGLRQQLSDLKSEGTPQEINEVKAEISSKKKELRQKVRRLKQEYRAEQARIRAEERAADREFAEMMRKKELSEEEQYASNK
jgi:hypothetical protein